MADEVQQPRPVSSNSSTWLWIAVIILVLLGGYYVFTRQAQAPGGTPPITETEEGGTPGPSDEGVTENKQDTGEVMDKETQEVVYENGKFSPSTITVKVGSVVRFVNKGDSEMWVASSPHPQHTDYPGFDQKEAAGSSGEYTFTFDKAGTWKYHNHKNPTAFGTVVVEE